MADLNPTISEIKFNVSGLNIPIKRQSLSEISQTEKGKYYMISLIYRIWKIIKMNVYTKQKQIHRHEKQTCGYQRGEGRGRDKLRVWD